MDLMQELVRYVSRLRFEHLSQDAVAVAKKSVIDTIGAIIAGSSVEGCKLLMDYVRAYRGPEESTIAVFGDKASAPLAALVNGAMARAREIDDVCEIRPLHPSASVIPTCFAIAEKQGTVTGTEFITAVAIGQDLAIRFNLATTKSCVASGRYNLFKIFACVGSGGKLLQLTEDQLWNAMGIAYSQMPGDMQALTDGAMTAYITQGTRAKAAIEAILMAERGITGSRNVLEGQYGFFKAFEPDCDLASLSFDLGKRFAGEDISIKLYTGCRFTHQPIELAQNFAREGLKPSEVDKVTVKCCAECYKLVGQPVEEKQRPRTRVDANFSIPFTVATALVKGDVFIEHVNDETIRDPEILDIAQRVTPVIDPEREIVNQVVGSVIMEITTKDGRKLVKETKVPKGHPKNPASMADCIAKFQKAAVHSRYPYSKKQLNKIVDIVGCLEKLDTMNKLISLLVPDQPS